MYISISIGLIAAVIGIGNMIPEGFICGETEQIKTSENIKLKQLPELVISSDESLREGVSGAFGGVLEDAVLIAGGCNFPELPAAEGGPKVYYDQIYLLCSPENKSAQWKLAGRFPVKVAYGAAVTMPQGVVCIGGRNDEQLLNTVWLLKWNEDKTRIIPEKLPSLPVAMDNMTASTDGKRIYVAGGNVDGKPENSCFVLKEIDEPQWEKLPAFPGANRLQPVSGVFGGKFYLIGGFQPVQGEQECCLPVEGVCYDPVKDLWETMGQGVSAGGTTPRSFVGAAAVALNDSVLVIAGGVDPVVFKTAVDNPLQQQKAMQAGQHELLGRLQNEQQNYLSHAPEWYRFNKQLYIYHVISGHWECAGQSDELARAGAAMVNYKNKIVIVNGECKPGIRSAAVSWIEW